MKTSLPSKPSLFSSVRWSLVDQVLVSASNFVCVLLLIRLLKIDGFGEYSIIWLAVLIVNSLHMGAIIFPMMSLAPKQKDASLYYSGVWQLQVVFVFIAVVVFSPLAFVYFTLSGIETTVQLMLQFIAVIVLYHTHDYLRRRLILDSHYIEVCIADSLAYVVRAMVFLYFVIVLDTVSLSSVLNTIISLYVVATLYLVYKCRQDFKLGGFGVAGTQHWSMAKWLIPSGLMQWSSLNLYMLAAPLIIGATSVGVIRAAQNIVGGLNVFLLALENVLPTRLSLIYSSEGLGALVLFFKRLMYVGVVGTAIIGIVLACLAKPLLVFLYGEAFATYYPVIWCFALIFICMFVVIPLRGVLRSLDLTKAWFRSYLIVSIVSLLLVYPLVVEYDIYGVLLGMLLSYILLLVLAGMALKKFISEERNESR